MQSDCKTQIIDYDGNIIEDLKEWMIRNNLSNLGFNYNVIAILGSQSSGKSTLLNNLFKTSFDVMNTKLGHSQTTQGLWLSYDTFEDNLNGPNGKVENENNQNVTISNGVKIKGKGNSISPTLILDVEGNDSKERGDNRLTFEHRSALFSLALADCVIVNLWYHSLGNFTASNYGLLKTVMEVNLELFQQDKNSPKTILLFTVRDWFEEFASIDIVKNKIVEEYLNKIWNEMKKPPDSEHININNYFIIEVVGLSHGIIKKEEFLKDVQNLRLKWMYELRPPQYSRNIPSDGFAQYCNNIWNTIVKQSQLDIPSQKEMLATFRCQEIKNNVINNINKTLKQKLETSHNMPIDNFKQWAEKDIIQKSLSEYLTEASRYKESICIKTSKELLDYLFIQLQKIVDNNLNFTQRELSTKFSNDLNHLYNACSVDKAIFSLSKESNLNIGKDKIHNLQTMEGGEKGSQDKCIILWSNFLHNADKMEYNILCQFFEEYEKCNIEVDGGTSGGDNTIDNVNINISSNYGDNNSNNDSSNNIRSGSSKVYEFNYKPSLSILSTAICKDVHRIRNVQCSVLLDRTRATIKGRLKNMDTLLQTTKNAEDYWEHTLKTVKNLQESINTNLTKCFINLRVSNNNALLKSYFYQGDMDDEGIGVVYGEVDEGDKFNYAQNKQKKNYTDDSNSNRSNNNHNNSNRSNACYGDKNQFNAKKIGIIKNKEKYISSINDEINKQMENKNFVSELNKYYLDEIMDILKSKLEEISENLSTIIIQRFESVFNYDDAEQPRQWRDISAAELKKIFRESKNFAFLIIDILQKNTKVELIDDYLPNNFIKDEIIQKGENKAKRKIQEICRDAQYIQETGAKMSLKNVPLLFWAILLVLGWNELLLFIRVFFKLNIILPFLLTFIVVFCSLVYNGNVSALSTVNKVFFYFAKNSYNFYKHIQTIGDKATKADMSD
ncbi:protein SEY1, putative [Plasmodium malariae]|uniref:Protein SEY1 homolog n=1 Tax=Plasmodium malariae TaxID=5858 RepID=A0A1A8W9K4_PLAMA|nr:protein SEY1, putative [Plasmodium malariae]SBS89705.1 protein SEY1, putative (SEY1) [Plasmodium malariae]SCP02776.1 protein SEY1, putative [Plasmodium malariae]